MSPLTRAWASCVFSLHRSFRALDLPPRSLVWGGVVVVVVEAVVVAAAVAAAVVVVEVVVAVVVVVSVAVVIVVVGVATRRRTMPSSPTCQPQPLRVLAQPVPCSSCGGGSAIPPRTGGHAAPVSCGPTCAKMRSARPTRGPLT